MLTQKPIYQECVWTAMDPVSKLLLVMVVGDHSLAVAQAVVHQVKRRLAAHCLPVFLTDGLAHYKLALLTHFGRWALAGEGAIKARWFPVPGLIYAQVIKFKPISAHILTNHIQYIDNSLDV